MASLNGFYVVAPDGSRFALTPVSQPVTHREDLTKLTGKALGVRIRDLRTAKRLSQRQLAAKTGLTHAAVNRIEKGKTKNPHRTSVETISNILFG
jgi:ribosome-binding protein aMBF1 (putative translation factor)